MSLPALEELLEQLSELPGIGRRSAGRIAFHLLRNEPSRAHNLATAIRKAREAVCFCDECGGLSESPICPLCDSSARERRLLCVVEEPQDLFAIEQSGAFDGLYHVLMGAISPLDGVGPQDLRITSLLERLNQLEIDELFIATNPTLEGDATAHYLQQLLVGRELTITRISHGLATGGAIEHADRTTLAHSIRSRQPLRR